jgi:hypothetical protein
MMSYCVHARPCRTVCIAISAVKSFAYCCTMRLNVCLFLQQIDSKTGLKTPATASTVNMGCLPVAVPIFTERPDVSHTYQRVALTSIL